MLSMLLPISQFSLCKLRQGIDENFDVEVVVVVAPVEENIVDVAIVVDDEEIIVCFC
ncbi:hypothetical protein MtrunA17_Chr1g0213551 [Medicago truncatula]|uniref:Uncharacterized protein n=1 Tax=Medicago truncatula TaxID=3880 RepID=A0A396JWS3_MEDTR|nr:hypothetical protein MtrunA17_Chr1g0213551 [Medicago truncatula]